MRDATNIADLAQSTAHQLRLLQADLAGESADVRARSLADVVRDATAQVIPEQRVQFLRTLEDSFPTFPGESSAGNGAAPIEMHDPMMMGGMLAAQGAGLSADQKQQIVDQLREGGFPIGSGGSSGNVGGGGLPQSLQELARPLQLAANAKIDSTRAAELLVILVDFAVKLDQAVWSSWSQVSPQSAVRRPGVLQRTMGRFLAGEQISGQMSQDAETLLKLAASLVVSIQKIGPALFRQYFDPISPNTIKEEVEWSLRGKEAQCWRKYEERAGTMEASAFCASLLSAVGKFVQEFFFPGGAPAKPKDQA